MDLVNGLEKELKYSMKSFSKPVKQSFLILFLCFLLGFRKKIFGGINYLKYNDIDFNSG